MSGLALVEATPEEIASADAVVLLTDHDAFDLDVSPRTHATFSTCGTHSKATTSNIFNLGEMQQSAIEPVRECQPVNDMVLHLP